MNGLHHFWFVWAWPSLKGNGPEDVIGTIGVAVIASLLWPPARRAIHRFVDAKTLAIKAHVTGHHRAHAEELDELRRRLDHIIANHPDIPDLPDASPAAADGPVEG